jgi:hypothetical protein
MPCLQVVLAEGDLNSENLGLSAATTQQLLEQVDIVIHSAASIGEVQCASGCCASEQLQALAWLGVLRCSAWVAGATAFICSVRGLRQQAVAAAATERHSQ